MKISRLHVTIAVTETRLATRIIAGYSAVIIP